MVAVLSILLGTILILLFIVFYLNNENNTLVKDVKELEEDNHELNKDNIRLMGEVITLKQKK